MKLTKYSQLKHGMKVRYQTDTGDIVYGTINESNSEFYFTRDEVHGEPAVRISYDLGQFCMEVKGIGCSLMLALKDFQSVEGLRAMKPGDILVDHEDVDGYMYSCVLEVLDNVFLVTHWCNKIDYARQDTSVFCWTTFEKAEKYGWKLLDQFETKDDIKELTMDEIADKFGIDVSKLKIKKEQ
jgi:hypothetical protein